MIFDKLNELADAASVAATASTFVLGDQVIDLGTQPADLGNGEPIYIVIQTDTEIITGGSAGTIKFDVVSDSLATLGAAVVADCTTHIAGESIVTDGTDANGAKCKAGATILCVPLPYGTYERYLGVLCTVGTTTTTAGKVNAFLTKDPAKYKAYSDFT